MNKGTKDHRSVSRLSNDMFKDFNILLSFFVFDLLKFHNIGTKIYVTKLILVSISLDENKVC